LITLILALILSSVQLPVSYSQEPVIPEMSLPLDLLTNLKTEHPRLHASTKDFAALKNRIATDETLKTWYDEILKTGEKLLDEAPSIYIIPDGLRLLSTSRRVVDRIYTLGFLYQLTGNDKFADRAWKETGSSFKNFLTGILNIF